MKIIIDVMSGDNAPEELLRGAVEAANAFPVDIAVCGNAEIIDAVARECRLDLSMLEICHAPQVIDMEDSALSVMREKNDSSMALGLKMLYEGKGDAFVSAGNTGAGRRKAAGRCAAEQSGAPAGAALVIASG